MNLWEGLAHVESVVWREIVFYSNKIFYLGRYTDSNIKTSLTEKWLGFPNGFTFLIFL